MPIVILLQEDIDKTIEILESFLLQNQDVLEEDEIKEIKDLLGTYKSL